MTRGTMEIYKYLHAKHVSQHTTIGHINQPQLSNLAQLGTNGIEFRSCPMMLAIHNDAQMTYAMANYRMDSDELSYDHGSNLFF